MTFRTRLLLTSFAAAAVSLLIAALLMTWFVRRSVSDRIARSLVAEARLAAAALADRRPATAAELDAEAGALGRLIAARVTFVAPDGRVVGDSELSGDALAGAENHAGRPEILQAAREGLGISRRYSETLGTDMLYVAARVDNAAVPQLWQVRLALPLTDIAGQTAAVRRIGLIALGTGLLAALAISWLMSVSLGRRVRAIAAAAERYAAGDLSQPARDHGTDEIGTVARALDDSVREVARRATELGADRARMQAVLSGMIEGVLVVNAQGRLQLVNRAARQMLRVQESPENRHYLEIVRHPDIAALIGAALSGGTPEGLELTLPGNPELIVVARSAPVEASASGGGAVLVVHDITSLRRADRVRRDFVANVSHELRTPLTAIRGYVEALLEGGAAESEVLRFLEIVGRHTLRMERLVRDLLRLARLDAGQEPLERVPCSVDALFAGVETELNDAVQARRLSVERSVAADAGIVPGDPAKLHDALRNLLENAINYSPEGGRIQMAARRCGDRICLTVADEGPGIPEADLSRIFERFYRVDKARSRSARDPGGTGLGLAIVRHLIELHGGRVSAANRPEGGALFTIELPL